MERQLAGQRADRNRILKDNGFTPRKYDGTGSISEVEYAAVPPPINSQAQPAGNCLIWLGTLTKGGYGTRTFPQGTTLAHREAFKESRGREPTDSVLHLCNRRYCVQPSHLYDGTEQDNSNDRRLLTSQNIELGLSFDKTKVIQAVAKYRWPDPVQAQVPMDGLPEGEDTHECNFIISAGDVKLCQTCNRPDPASWEFGKEPTITPGQLQKPGTDRNSVQIQKTKTMVTEVAPGVAFVGTGKTDINLATSRAEHRRRQRAESKRDMSPRLLSVERTNITTNETRTVFKSEEELLGPGLVVVVGTPVKKVTPPPPPSRAETIARDLLKKTKRQMDPGPRHNDGS